jgi:hypothetical protein
LREALIIAKHTVYGPSASCILGSGT